MKEMIEEILLRYYNAPPINLIEELSAIADEVYCDECGCTELLCGHNKKG